MGLFSRKPRVGLETFCREFYEKNLLNATIRDVDMDEVYYRTVQDSVAEVDRRFADLDIRKLIAEMTVIRFEIFAVAWLHQVGDKLAAAQSAFTKRYLEERERADIWGAMEPYNQAIARSSTLGQTNNTPTGRGYLTFINSMRADLFDAWHKEGFDSASVARAANRLATDVAWKEGLTPAFVMLTLCEHLGCELNEEGQERVIFVIRGFYDGVREALTGIAVEAQGT